ncbi:MAG TPA: hypothetical protein VHW03_04530 [Chthoniobacterales bacterium]|jgi:hypothetical protein|nr:hypothetical protein [Chthoniobacterales bacterium]
MTPARLDLTMTRGITFGPIVINCYSDLANTVPVDLTGYTAFAQVRPNSTSTLLVFDLTPSISNAAAGQITIPEISYTATAAKNAGNLYWDLVLQDGAGNRLGPLVKGNFVIGSAVTQPPTT